MNDYLILERVVNSAIRAAVRVEQLTGDCDVIIATASLPVIILDVTEIRRKTIPIEIRWDKDKMGWLYTANENTYVVFISSNKLLAVQTIAEFKAAIETKVKEYGKQFSDTPTAYKLYRGDNGSIHTYMNWESVPQPSN